MKRFLLLCFWANMFSAAFGQQNEDVYFDKNYHKKTKLMNLPNMSVSQEHWYVGGEGIFKKNYTTLDNNLLGLIASENTSNVTWGIQLGYNFDNKWGIETGYLANTQETYLYINASRIAPLSSKFTLHSIPIRYKKNIFTIDKSTKTASLWLSGGVLISPNSTEQKINSLTLYGTKNVVRGADGKVVSYDSLTVPINSYLTNRGLIQLEIGVELQGKIAEGFNIITFLRGNLGSNSVIHTDASYIINTHTDAETSLTTNGFSYSFGMALRYDVGRNVRYKNRQEE
jgi:hypothetical protein